MRDEGELELHVTQFPIQALPAIPCETSITSYYIIGLIFVSVVVQISGKLISVKHNYRELIRYALN